MNIGNILISEPDFMIKTQMQSGTKNIMKNRYASGIIILLCGKLEFVFGDCSVICRENDAVFIPEGESYRFNCFEYAESIVINFHTVGSKHTVMPLRKIDKKTAEAFFDELNALLLKEDENRNMILATYYRLLSAFFDNKMPVSTSESYVNHAENIILNQFSSPHLSCSAIAKEVNISEVYLRKLFIKHRNMPTSKYLLQVRMNHAQRLIFEGYSISATAENTGYCDIYQFSRAYKKYFGISPSKCHEPEVHDIG